jgi:hypothetical protein
LGKSVIRKITLSLFPLLIGGFIYILFRSDVLLMFEWLEKLNIIDEIYSIRKNTLPLKSKLPNWFLFSLPDGLWIFSYVSLILLVWDNKLNNSSIFWILIIPGLAVLSEILQFFDICSGTFDVMDLIFYISGLLTPLLFLIHYNKKMNI